MPASPPIGCARRGASAWILIALPACFDPSVAPPIELVAGDLLIFASEDQVSLLQPGQQASVLASGGSILRIPGRAFVDEAGLPLSSERLASARVVREPTRGVGECGRCLGSARSHPVVVHDGDFCALPKVTELVEGPDVRSELSMAWPGSCDCDIPHPAGRAGRLRWQYAMSPDGYEPPRHVAIGPAGEVASMGTNELRVFRGDGTLSTHVRRLNEPLSCDDEPSGEGFENYFGVGVLSPERVLLVRRDAPGDVALELWRADPADVARLARLPLARTPTGIVPLSASRALLSYERVEPNQFSYDECSLLGDAVACHSVEDSALTQALSSPLKRGDELYAVKLDAPQSQGIVAARRAQDGSWEVVARSVGGTELALEMELHTVGLGRTSGGLFLYLCAEDGDRTHFLRTLAPGRGTSLSWLQSATFELFHEKPGTECLGFLSSETGPALAALGDGWLSLGETVERLDKVPGTDAPAFLTVGSVDRALVYSAAGHIYVRNSSSALSKIAGPNSPVGRAFDDDFSASAVRDGEVWLFAKVEARVVKPDPLTLRTVPLDWGGPPFGRVRAARYLPARDRFLLAGGDTATVPRSGWAALLGSDGVVSDVTRIAGAAVLDAVQILDDRFVLVVDDGRLLEWNGAELTSPEVEWDDPATPSVEDPPPVVAPDCESRRPGDRESPLKATHSSRGTAWISGCGGLLARAHPGFVERVAVKDGSDFTSVQALCPDVGLVGARSSERGSFAVVRALASPLDRLEALQDVAGTSPNRFSDSPIETFAHQGTFAALFVNSLQLTGLTSRVTTPNLLLTAQSSEDRIVVGGKSGVLLVVRECP
ncbi:MAG: hypothetical protein HY791_40300 [Deltaproteobacteria bacterium]|nr:hypothetical protein [Deltaproteobacteria bacterium]